MAFGREVVRLAGVRMHLWRAVDHKGEVVDTLVQRRRDSRAALRLMRKLIKSRLRTEMGGNRQAALRQLGIPTSLAELPS